MIIKYGKFAKESGGVIDIQSGTANEIAYVLETLYREREDFRAQIMALNGFLLCGGSAGGYIGGTGDDDIRWYSSGHSPQNLEIKIVSQESIKVSVSNVSV